MSALQEQDQDLSDPYSLRCEVALPRAGFNEHCNKAVHEALGGDSPIRESGKAVQHQMVYFTLCYLLSLRVVLSVLTFATLALIFWSIFRPLGGVFRYAWRRRWSCDFIACMHGKRTEAKKAGKDNLSRNMGGFPRFTRYNLERKKLDRRS